MHKLIKRKSPVIYPLLMVLILQLGLTSLLCAVAPYQSSASPLSICTSFGLQTIMVDENGQPAQEGQQHEFQKSCFHCASGGCNGVILNHQEIALYQQTKQPVIQAGNQIRLIIAQTPRPPTRAPPHTV